MAIKQVVTQGVSGVSLGISDKYAVATFISLGPRVCSSRLRHATGIAVLLSLVVWNLGSGVGAASLFAASGQAVYVDLKYLAEHMGEFENASITTNGTVRFYGSIYMYEDFWLQAQNDDAKIMVVTRLAGLSVPSEMAEIEVGGVVKHSMLEGGFYFLEASSWRTVTPRPTPTPTPTQTLSPTPPSMPTPSPTPTLKPTPTATVTPMSNGEGGSLSPEAFYAAAIIGAAFIIVIAITIVALKKQKR